MTTDAHEYEYEYDELCADLYGGDDDGPQSDNAPTVGDGEGEVKGGRVGEHSTHVTYAKLASDSRGAADSVDALEPPPETTVGLDNALWLARVHDLPVLDAYEKDGSLHPGRSFDQRTTDPETIKRWFTDALGQPNERNVAIVMGLWNGRRRSGIDFDGKNGRPGLENHKIMVAAGLIPADSLTFRTKSDGLHVVSDLEGDHWLAMNAVNWKGEDVEGLNLIVRDGCTGVDIRGENGVLYTVGSEMFRGGAYQVEKNVRIAPLPAKGVAVFGSARAKAAPTRGEVKVAEGVELDSDGNRARAISYLVNEAPRAIQGVGGRKVSMAVLQRLLDFGCSYDEAIDLMLDCWNEEKADPPWDDAELRATFRGIEGSRETPVGSKTAEHVFGAADDADREAFDKQERARAEKAEKAEKAEAKPGANPGGGVDFRDVRVKRAPYVMKGWLHRGETVQWFGPPGAGKSASLLSIMLASAAAPPEGALFAGCRVKRGLMIFAAYERAGETQDRLAAAGKRLSLPDDIPFVLLTRPPLLKDGEAVKSVIGIIRHYEKLHGLPCSVFAIDTLTAARPGMGQSDDAEMSKLMNHLQYLRDTVGCCLPFIHHPTKADANNPRGSGVTTGHVDKEVVVNKGRIRMQKNNAGPDAGALDLKIESVHMGEDEDGDPISVAYANIKPGRVGVDDTFDAVKEGEGASSVAGACLSD
jgi:hypothetical protein